MVFKSRKKVKYKCETVLNQFTNRQNKYKKQQQHICISIINLINIVVPWVVIALLVYEIQSR